MYIPVDSTTVLNQLRPSFDSVTANERINRINDQFAKRLEQALKVSTADSIAIQKHPQAVAELLNLQMMQSSLSLVTAENNNDLTAASQRPNQILQSLITSYSANFPTTPNRDGTPKVESKVVSESQLPDLEETENRTAEASTQRQRLSKSYNKLENIDDIITAASERYGVDAELIKAVIKAESNFNPNAVSHAGARGLMQLMPKTARALGVQDSFNPEQNVMGGTRFLRDMLHRYNGDLDSALAAYNWGPGNVDKHPEHLPRETVDYLARVKQLYGAYQG